MEGPTTALDPHDPDVRVDFSLARAEVALATVNRAAAEKMSAVHAAVTEARAFPEVFLGPCALPDPAFAERAVIADLAVRLSESEQAVRAQAAQAATLIAHTPLVWAAFRSGTVSIPNARTVAELVAARPEHASEFDAAVVDAATRLAPARFRSRARAVLERLAPSEAAERHLNRMDDRGVWVDHDLDGMSWLTALIPSHVAQKAMASLDASAMKLLSGDHRTLAQLRADLLGDLLTGVGSASVGVRVGVTVPVLTLLGRSDEPGILEGYGPIDADTARELAGEATSFHRILTDPISGTVLDVDRKHYRPPADLTRWLQLRDQVCGFPGCGRVARACDLDHIVDWAAGGTTSAANLVHLCRHHHRLKHQTGWRSRMGPQGRVEWTSPTGRVRAADPPAF